MLTDKQNQLIQKTARDIGLNHFSVNVEAGSQKGDNYLGHIYQVTLKESSGKEDGLILKCADENEAVRSQLPVHLVYQREVYLYETVLPSFLEFQKKHRLKLPFKAFAKVHGHSLENGHEFLLMENIKLHGFRMMQRQKTMDEAHVKVVFRELAKLHSVSLAMKHLEPDTFKNFSENLDDIFTKSGFFKNIADGYSKKIGRGLKAVEGDQRATEAIKKCQNLEESFKDLANPENHLVITHGDPWCNNMMFKYEDKSNPHTPTSLCFLDWQMSKVQSPLLDLFYFFCLSASKSTLENHKRYFDLYYETVDENLRSIGLDTKCIFPYALFQDHMKKYAKFGLMTTLTNLDILMRDSKEAKSFSDCAEDGQNILEEVWNNGELGGEVCQRIRDLIAVMLENNYV